MAHHPTPPFDPSIKQNQSGSTNQQDLSVQLSQVELEPSVPPESTDSTRSASAWPTTSQLESTSTLPSSLGTTRSQQETTWSRWHQQERQEPQGSWRSQAGRVQQQQQFVRDWRQDVDEGGGAAFGGRMNYQSAPGNRFGSSSGLSSTNPTPALSRPGYISAPRSFQSGNNNNTSSSPSTAGGPYSRTNTRSSYVAPSPSFSPALASSRPAPVATATPGRFSPFSAPDDPTSASTSSLRQLASSSKSQARSLPPETLGPAGGAENYTLWVGNVPSDSTEDELVRFFSSRPPPSGVSHWDSGVQSVFLISRTNCCFVQYDTDDQLQHGLRVNSGVRLRLNDSSCKPFVCRIRGKEQAERAGVGWQRLGKVHRAYVANLQQQQAQQQQVRDGEYGHPHQSSPFPPLQSTSSGPGASLASTSALAAPEELSTEDAGTDSDASNSSTWLATHFPRRYFVLKSSEAETLDQAIASGTWRTQLHHCHILNKAFRTGKHILPESHHIISGLALLISSSSTLATIASDGVFLFFSANRSGEWRGVARMQGTISSETESAALSTDSSKILSKPFEIDWMATVPMPFRKIRKIKNTFNEDREIKVSRDGCEVDPSAGETLLQLLLEWSQLHGRSSSAPSSSRQGRSFANNLNPNNPSSSSSGSFNRRW